MERNVRPMERFAISSRFSASSKGVYSGLASVFDNVIDSEGYGPTIIRKGAFTKTLQENGEAMPMLYQHDICAVIGQTLSAFEGNTGLNINWFFADTSRAAEVQTLVDEGIINALSIGFSAIRTMQGQLPNGSIGRIITELQLFEISCVLWPADSKALITTVPKSEAAGIRREFKDRKKKDMRDEALRREIDLTLSEHKSNVELEREILEAQIQQLFREKEAEAKLNREIAEMKKHFGVH